MYFSFCLYLQALNGRQSLSPLSISVRTALCWPLTRLTPWTASRSAARRERRRRERWRGSPLNQTGGHYHPNPVSPEICFPAGQRDPNAPQPRKIYLKMSQEAKLHGRLKAPRQKPAEAAQTLPPPPAGRTEKKPRSSSKTVSPNRDVPEKSNHHAEQMNKYAISTFSMGW